MTRYNKIQNNTIERTHTTHSYVYWDDIYTEDELKLLTEYCSKLNTVNGQIGTINPIGNIDTQIRSSDVAFVYYDDEKSDDIKWFFHKTNDVIDSLNEKFYQFDLNGYDQFQYTEYDANKNAKYLYHLDMHFGKTTIAYDYRYEQRKLSFILCLSDPSEYEGGKLSIKVGENNDIEITQKRGRVIVLPSFMLHKISEVTSGMRKSIVIWTTGPKFK
jgi:PKHD-type hydroxylase